MSSQQTPVATSQIWLLAPRLALILTLPDPAPVDRISRIAVGK